MNDTPRSGYRITRVYTKSGDQGDTGLVGGQRVPKDHPRIEAYGTVDELSSAIGCARAALATELPRFTDPSKAPLLDSHLKSLQNGLFIAGGDLATCLPDRHPAMPVVTADDVAALEALCDAFNQELAPLTNFVLPAGSATAAALHLARTVARRAERRVISLARQEDLGPHVAIYLNRLSDALFVLARWANMAMGVPEDVWEQRKDDGRAKTK